MIAEKTSRQKIVPIEQKLNELLLDAFAIAEEGRNGFARFPSMACGGTFKSIEDELVLRNGKMLSRLCVEIVKLTGLSNIHNMQYQLGLDMVSRFQQNIIYRS